MNKNVILFLTSPNSPTRANMCLKNFKQLEKLNYDIITLTTTDFLPEYIYEKSKCVIHDYNTHVCSKKDYYNYYKQNGGNGYFFWEDNGSHKVKFFQETHYPAVLRHTRTLVHFAKALMYENYFYVEDDHFFHDSDLSKIDDIFKKLDENDMVIFSFRRDGPTQNQNEYVYCCWFHFGKTEKCSNLFKNFAYTSEEFVSRSELYLHFYEYMFKYITHLYKTDDFKILELTEDIISVFKNSTFNKIYSYSNISDDIRCNFIYDCISNRNVLYYKTNGLKQNVNLKIYIQDQLFNECNLTPGNWYYIPIDNQSINHTKVILNNTVVKSFKNLKLEDIIYNGEMVQ